MGEGERIGHPCVRAHPPLLPLALTLSPSIHIHFVFLQTFAYGGRAKKLKADIKAALIRSDVRELSNGDLTPAARAALAGLTGEREGAGRGGRAFLSPSWPHSIPNLPHPHPLFSSPPPSGAWVGRKAVSDRRLRCFARAIEWEALELGGAGGARLFCATAKAEGDGPGRPAPITPASLDAFVLLDPLWRGGRVVGYCPAVSQAREGAHHGVIKALYEAGMAAARADLAAADADPGNPALPSPATFTLGLAPVYDLSGEVFTRARLLRDAHLFLRTCGNGLYAYQAVGGAKARWGGAGKGVPGVSSPHVYIAQRTWAPWTLELLDMWVCLRFVGIGRGVHATARKLVGWEGRAGRKVEGDKGGVAGRTALAG